jgi:ParB-like nuclease domain
MTSVKDLKGELVDRDVESLDLDPQNPRLPEELAGSPQRDLLRYLSENLVLDELAQSFVDNGFFMHEPLIIMPSKKGRYTVLEGNRRLAALMILHGRLEAEELSFDIEIPKRALDRLKKIPCYEVKNRTEVYSFLGFRHIGGIKTWGAEAKARYIAREVDDTAKRGSRIPFKDVGKRVGSNTQGVRNSYIALTILRYARSEFSADVRTLQNERFGVWQRALNSPEIREYIGFGDARDYEEISKALRQLKDRNLKRVLSDLTPSGDSKKAVVEDSRDITDYGRILANAKASEILAKYKDFDVAKQVVDVEELPKRIERIKRECDILLQEVQNAEPSVELVDAAKILLGVVRSIVGAARQLMDEDDE